MKRREFLINTALTLGMTAFATAGFANEQFVFNQGQVVRRKIKDIEIPLIGMCAKLFPIKDEKINMREVDDIVDYCMQHGVNYFDTSYVYCGGNSENIIGKSLSRYSRQDFILANKCPIQIIKSREDFRKIFDEQCKKCKVDYFDFYLCQDLSAINYDKYKQNNMYDELLKLKNEGRIKYIGFSFYGTPELLEKVLRNHEWDFCQLQMNYLDWNVANIKKQYEIIKKAGIPVIATESLRFGQLSAKLDNQAIEKLKENYPNITPSQFGLRWTASRKNVVTVLASMHSFTKIKQDVNTFINFKEMDKKEEKVVNEIVKVIKSKNQIYCISCPNCYKVCPNGVEILANFNLYNTYKDTNDKTKFAKKYEELPESQRADKCTKCGICNKNCPQCIQIPDMLAKIYNEYLEISKTNI